MHITTSPPSWSSSSKNPNPAYAPVRVETRVFGLSDIGRRRDTNEDALLALEREGLYVVCDGVGGRRGGEVASQLATHAVASLSAIQVEEQTEEPSTTQARSQLATAIRYANGRVRAGAEYEEELEGMATTVVALKLYADFITVGHVGDSRLYRWRADEGLVCLTRDHSLFNQLLDEGTIPAHTDQRTFAFNNVITRSLGGYVDVTPEVSVHERRQGDVYLLCTDGLSDRVSDAMVEKVLARYADDVATAASLLVDSTLRISSQQDCAFTEPDWRA